MKRQLTPFGSTVIVFGAAGAVIGISFLAFLYFLVLTSDSSSRDGLARVGPESRQREVWARVALIDWHDWSPHAIKLTAMGTLAILLGMQCRSNRFAVADASSITQSVKKTDDIVDAEIVNLPQGKARDKPAK